MGGNIASWVQVGERVRSNVIWRDEGTEAPGLRTRDCSLEEYSDEQHVHHAVLGFAISEDGVPRKPP